jgi:hypothetical protein
LEPGLPLEEQVQRTQDIGLSRVVRAHKGCDPIAVDVSGGYGSEIPNGYVTDQELCLWLSFTINLFAAGLQHDPIMSFNTAPAWPFEPIGQ